MVRGPSSAASRFSRCVRAFEQEFDYLYRLLVRHGVARDDAEDVVQEVFAVMWRRWEDFQSDRPLRPWLAGIAVRQAYQYLRRRREIPTPGLDPGEVAASLDDRLDARSLLRRALEQVPETNRSALMLHDLDGLPMREVAEALSIPVATAYTRVGRGRRAFVQAARHLQGSRRQKLPVIAAPDALAALAREPVDVPKSARARALRRARELDTPVPEGISRAARLARGTAPYWAAAAALVVATSLIPRLPAFGQRARPVAAPSGERASPPPAWSRPGTLTASLAIAPPGRVPALRALPQPAIHRELAHGLAGYWRFDEGHGSPVSRDLSEGRHDCVLRGLDPESAWLDGALGPGVDVQKGWIECPQPATPATPSTEVTVAAWVRAAALTPGHMALVARQLGQGRDDYFFLGLLDGKLKVFGSLWGWPVTAKRPLPLDRWVHVAFTHAADGTTRLYQDGVKIGLHRARPSAVVRGLAAPRLSIGSGINGPGEGQREQQLSGAIDEVAVYDRALGPDQVAALAAGAQPSGR